MYGILLTKEQLDFLKDDRHGFHRMTAFDTFVSMASIKPTSYQKTGFSTRLSIGQFAISTVELSALWKCDRKTAAKVIDLFNQVGILSTERNNRTSIHTIRCIAFWYIDGIKDAIKNPFITAKPFRHPHKRRACPMFHPTHLLIQVAIFPKTSVSRKTMVPVLPLSTFCRLMFRPSLKTFSLPLSLEPRRTNFQILLSWHKTLKRGKRKVVMIALRLDSR